MQSVVEQAENVFAEADANSPRGTMTIKPYQSNPNPIGQFDILDADLANLRGGEVLVFDRTSGDLASPDVYVGDGYRTLLRVAEPSDLGPFFISDIGNDAAESVATFGFASGISTNNSQSGKVSIYADDGIYNVSSDVVDALTVNQLTNVYDRLYSDANGHLTTTPGSAGAIVGYFIEYQKGTLLRGFPNRLQFSTAHRENDSILFYKTNMPVSLSNQVIVKTAADLKTIDPTKEYFIDGVVDMTGSGISIEIPEGDGLKIAGYDFNTSKIICSDDNYTLFTSPSGGSGNVLADDFSIEITGTNSKVWDVVDSTGFNAIEFFRVNYNNCTSLGIMSGYRQGLETGTGRFGGTPTLELADTWLGGYRITTSIVRGIDDAMAAPLFKAGAGFNMNSRFLTDINADLGTTASLLDFAPANFPDPSLLQIQGAIITRNGVSNADDATLTPNIAASNLESSWRNNQGLSNTFVGGTMSDSSEAATTIVGAGAFVDLAGTWATSKLQHFDSPVNGQLRHLGNNPREFEISGTLQIAGTAGDVVTLKIVKWDNSGSSFEDVGEVTGQILNLPGGGSDIAFMTVILPMTLDQNDFVKLQVANLTGIRDVTAKLNSFISAAGR